MALIALVCIASGYLIGTAVAVRKLWSGTALMPALATSVASTAMDRGDQVQATRASASRDAILISRAIGFQTNSEYWAVVRDVALLRGSKADHRIWVTIGRYLQGHPNLAVSSEQRALVLKAVSEDQAKS